MGDRLGSFFLPIRIFFFFFHFSIISLSYFLLPIFDKLYISTISKILDKHIRLVFAILLVLHIIGDTYLNFYFYTHFTSDSVAEWSKAPLRWPGGRVFETHQRHLDILLFSPLRPSLSPSFSLSSQRNFPISFKPKVAKAKFYWKMQRKTWYSILGLDAEPLP